MDPRISCTRCGGLKQVVGQKPAGRVCSCREAAIYADVFNPAESDRQYYERRLRELEKRDREAPRNAN